MKELNIIEKINKIDQYITQHEIKDINEIKQKGAIYTPIVITYDMLDNLVNSYKKEYNENIFENEKLKWYDNSFGIGNIVLIVYLKLMDGLKDKIKNYSDRKKHILENMLFMSEINKQSVEKFEFFINRKKKYKLNIYVGNSLNFDIKKIFLIDSFDIVIGNPPFQKENKKNNLARGGTNNNLYVNFIKKSIEVLKPNGYLVYIHPQNWRKINSDIFDIFIDNNLLHISLNYGGKLFKNVSVKTDYYILKKINDKAKPKIKTYIKCYNGKNNLIDECEMIIQSIDFIPNVFNQEIKNIFEKINKYGEKRECIINSDCHKIREHVLSDTHKNFTENFIRGPKSEINKYPLFNTSGNPFEYYSSRPHKDQFKKKVIMSSSGKLAPFYDDGKYGTTQDSMYFFVLDKDSGEKLVKILNSSLYKFLIKICQWGNFRNEPKLLSYLKYPVIATNTDITDKYINEFFKFDENETKQIQKFI